MSAEVADAQFDFPGEEPEEVGGAVHEDGDVAVGHAVTEGDDAAFGAPANRAGQVEVSRELVAGRPRPCLLYTSDAADE